MMIGCTLAAVAACSGRHDGATTTAPDGSTAEASVDLVPELPTSDQSSSERAPELTLRPDGGIAEALCGQMCTVTLEVDCPHQPSLDACVRDCGGGAATCVGETTALFECIVANGATALDCDPEDDSIFVKDGYCVDQRMAAAGCISDKVTLGEPPAETSLGSIRLTAKGGVLRLVVMAPTSKRR